MVYGNLGEKKWASLLDIILNILSSTGFSSLAGIQLKTLDLHSPLHRLIGYPLLILSLDSQWSSPNPQAIEN